MPYTAASIPDLSGRVAVVTGANGGLGLETARALARAGAHVVMATRDQARAAAAESDILAAQPGASLALVPLDLRSLVSIADAATTISDRYQQVDILINNAGIMAVPEGRTKDGFETQIGVNHLGHFALTAQLLGPLLASDAGRVVTVTSVARFRARPIGPEDPHLESGYGPWKAYSRSKLANLHFALGLQDRFAAAGTSTISVAAHPGFTHTDLQARSVREGRGGVLSSQSHFFARHLGMTPADGALSQIRAATDPEVQGGELYGPRYGLVGPPVRRPVLRRKGVARAIDRLWYVSERETGLGLDVVAVLDDPGR
jgi:NAD(P)-dependent dehydrogenase (short-subunit alcohol dehydrogenase family)